MSSYGLVLKAIFIEKELFLYHTYIIETKKNQGNTVIISIFNLQNIASSYTHIYIGI